MRLRGGDAVADRDGFHRVNREDRLRDAAVELLVPLHVRAEADGDVVRGDDDRAAEGFAGFARLDRLRRPSPLRASLLTARSGESSSTAASSSHDAA